MTVEALDHHHEQWQDVLVLADELSDAVPLSDPHGPEALRHLGTLQAVVRAAITANRRARPDHEQATLDLGGEP